MFRLLFVYFTGLLLLLGCMNVAGIPVSSSDIQNQVTATVHTPSVLLRRAMGLGEEMQLAHTQAEVANLAAAAASKKAADVAPSTKIMFKYEAVEFHHTQMAEEHRQQKLVDPSTMTREQQTASRDWARQSITEAQTAMVDANRHHATHKRPLKT